MRIQHNIMAMNAYRNYNTNTSALAKNLEKLSSGYKINRAGDDAAGLAISEKMRAQITGLNAAQKNVKDGISLVKTAEGAMQEIHDMLNRMDYLATQSANGTYDNEVDRVNLQKEVNALKTEINRIADSANFNGIKLLDGSLGESSSTTKVEGLEDVSFTKKTDSQLAGPAAQKGSWEIDLSQFKFTSKEAAKDKSFDIKVGGTVVATVTLGATGTALGVGDKDFKVTAKTGDLALGGTAKNTVNVKYDKETGKLTVTMKNTPTTTGQVATGVPATNDLAVTVAASAANGATLNQVEINVNSVDGTGTSSVTLADGTGDVKISDILALKTVQEARGPGDERLYGSATFDLSGKIEDGTTLKIGDQSFTFAVGGASKFKGGTNVIDLTDMEADKLTDAKNMVKIAQRITSAFKDNKQFNVTFDNTGADLTFSVTEKPGSGLDYLGSAIVGEKSGKDEKGDATWEGMVMIGQGSISSSASGGLRLQIGDTADAFNQMSVVVGDMHVSAMGKGKTTLDGKEIESTKTIADVDISNQEGAAEAIGIIKNAINYVSGIRGDLGAVQNRLDHTAKNLSVMAENIQDAESTIRDTDVAEEMMAYTKNNILIQSAQAMLAQANAVPQGVLQLLG